MEFDHDLIATMLRIGQSDELPSNGRHSSASPAATFHAPTHPREESSPILLRSRAIISRSPHCPPTVSCVPRPSTPGAGKWPCVGVLPEPPFWLTMAIIFMCNQGITASKNQRI